MTQTEEVQDMPFGYLGNKDKFSSQTFLESHLCMHEATLDLAWNQEQDWLPDICFLFRQAEGLLRRHWNCILDLSKRMCVENWLFKISFQAEQGSACL